MNPAMVAAPVLAAAGAVLGYGAAYPRSQIFGATVCTTNAARKLAITFDDGPNPAITPQLLELLSRENAKATFFVIGRFAREAPELLREIAARGHVIGNHTENHPALIFFGKRAVDEQLTRCNEAIEAAVQRKTKWFRPPYGLRNQRVVPAASALGQRVAMWSLIPGDWNGKAAEWLIPRMRPIVDRARANANIADAAASGDVLCLHDGDHRHLNGDRMATVEALKYWLPRWRDAGLEFVTIDGAVS